MIPDIAQQLIARLRRVEAAEAARKLYTKQPTVWDSAQEDTLIKMVSHWQAMRWLVRRGKLVP